MKKKRTHIEVMHDILGVVKSKDGKTNPTRIFYKSNLSHEMMNKYLNELIEKSLLLEKKLENKKFYSLAPKGFQFLEKYELITNFTNSFGLSYN